MPFTFAHPAIIIPIKKKWTKWFSGTALILGSMSPDFEYFIRFKAQSVVGHTLIGFIIFNLPLVFIAAFLWHHIIKKPFTLSLPNIIKQKVIFLISNPWEINSIRSFTIFVVSAFTGMFSHILWDSFTHKDAYFVQKIPFLSQYIIMFDTKIAVYKILQHGSTLLGFLIIYLYIKRLKTNNIIREVNKSKKLIYWSSIFIAAFIIVIVRAIYTLKKISFIYSGIYIVSFISGLLIGIICISFLFQLGKVYEKD